MALFDVFSQALFFIVILINLFFQYLLSLALSKCDARGYQLDIKEIKNFGVKSTISKSDVMYITNDNEHNM